MHSVATKSTPALGLLLLVGCASGKVAGHTSLSAWPLGGTPLERTAGELDNDTHEHLAWARTCRDRIMRVDGARTVRNTLVPFNNMMMHLDSARWECELFAHVHPDRRVRGTAEKCRRKVLSYLTALRLDPELYDAFRALDPAGADRETRYVIRKIRRNLRRGGADRPAETRKRIAEVYTEIHKLERSFSANILADQRELLLDSPADLAGLPADWIRKHPPGADGKIRISALNPDYTTFMTYARSSEARQNLYRRSKSRGYPDNTDILDKLLAKRYELAQFLGYANWAEYAAEDNMVETAAGARSFIDRIAQLARQPARHDYELLLERKQRDFPGTEKVEDWEKQYYKQLLTSERCEFDPRSLRPYLDFPNVISGLFELTRQAFGIRYDRVHGLNLWDETVTAWDVFDGTKRIGRFYLDPYSRKGKYANTALFNYRTGIAGVRAPQAVLVCSIPDPRTAGSGTSLMDHDQVVTLFHEFGRLLQTLFAGHGQWMGGAGLTMESDFVEAPARLLDAWCYDPDALQVFAKYHRTGEPIPLEMVERLQRADALGRGLHVAQQAFYAAVSLALHDRNPKDLDPASLLIELQNKYGPFDHVDGTHFECGFEHLVHHSAVYYVFIWSRVISRDMLSAFDRNGLLNARTVQRFRRTIIEQGGSKEASEMIRDFLGRPHTLDTFKTWLDRS